MYVFDNNCCCWMWQVGMLVVGVGVVCVSLLLSVLVVDVFKKGM